jgi:hypothetical protein
MRESKYNNFYNNCRNVLAEAAVWNTRRELKTTHHTTDMTGLCDEACDLVMQKIEYFNKMYDFDYLIDFYRIHGEQRHTPMLESKYWDYQHTWMMVKFHHYNDELTLYIDPTIDQFSYMYDSYVPTVYISELKPKWFYPDAENPYWKLKFLNKSKLFPKLQYELWGRISDIIRKLNKERGE